MQSIKQSNYTYQCNFCQTHVLKQSKELHEGKCWGKNKKAQISNQEDQQSSPSSNLEQISNFNNSPFQTISLNPQSRQQNERQQFPQINIQQNQINIFTTESTSTQNQFKLNITDIPNESQSFMRQRENSTNLFNQNKNAFLQNIEQFPQPFSQIANQNQQQQQFNRNNSSLFNQSYFQQFNSQNQIQQQQQTKFRIEQSQQIQQQQPSQIFPPRNLMIGALQNNRIISTQNQIEQNRYNTQIQFPTPIQSNTRNDNQSSNFDIIKQDQDKYQDINGLNNFDLLKEYTDEEVNQMSDEQLYQYFIHKQINENHKNEIDEQVSKIKAEQELHEEESQCVICQDIIENESDSKTLDCMHKFHINCLSNWLNRKSVCPVCKSRV